MAAGVQSPQRNGAAAATPAGLPVSPARLPREELASTGRPPPRPEGFSRPLALGVESAGLTLPTPGKKQPLGKSARTSQKQHKNPSTFDRCAREGKLYLENEVIQNSSEKASAVPGRRPRAAAGVRKAPASPAAGAAAGGGCSGVRGEGAASSPVPPFPGWNCPPVLLLFQNQAEPHL